MTKKNIGTTGLLSVTLIAVMLFSLVGSCTSNDPEAITALLYSDGKPVAISIKDGKIAAVKKISDLPAGSAGLIVAPGFIDNQVNGYAGVSFTFGGGELTAEGVKKATRELWKTGVTTYIPTLTTNSNELLTKNFSILGAVKDDSALLGSIPGFHLEGPFISPVDGYRGAHPLRFVRKPDWEEFLQLNKSAGNNIIQVTLAPEMEGALDFISKCTEAGIVVGLGHHNADAQLVKEAIDRGADIATHLGNGCANMINRHINPLWPQLSDDRLMVSIICDGFHLNPEEIRVFYKVKGPGLTIITSDVTSYAALPPGKFVNVEGDTLELTPEGMVKYPAQNVLAGSASPLKKGIANIIRVTGCSLEDAVGMATRNPARLYNLDDRGEIATGKRADLVLFRMKDGEIIVEKTIVNGRVVFDREKKSI
ncbi:MAG: N-acetylglucosamine-6-phosphate deacetylase [Bacteroidales bacterium]|nr:N-acetylglucosamine-6-phosphate deacetylase [Bacteroidales bacterium]MBN2634095.1 N-acetylglucosamine-6-phosphate deacetylase [Bacteroidales bacterium]